MQFCYISLGSADVSPCCEHLASSIYVLPLLAKANTHRYTLKLPSISTTLIQKQSLFSLSIAIFFPLDIYIKSHKKQGHRFAIKANFQLRASFLLNIIPGTNLRVLSFSFLNSRKMYSLMPHKLDSSIHKNLPHFIL